MMHWFSSKSSSMSRHNFVYFSFNFKFDKTPNSSKILFKFLRSSSLLLTKQFKSSANARVLSFNWSSHASGRSTGLRLSDLLSFISSISITNMKIKQDRGLPCPVPFLTLKNSVKVFSSRITHDKLSFR